MNKPNLQGKLWSIIAAGILTGCAPEHETVPHEETAEVIDYMSGVDDYENEQGTAVPDGKPLAFSAFSYNAEMKEKLSSFNAARDLRKETHYRRKTNGQKKVLEKRTEVEESLQEHNDSSWTLSPEGDAGEFYDRHTEALVEDVIASVDAVTRHGNIVVQGYELGDEEEKKEREIYNEDTKHSWERKMGRLKKMFPGAHSGFAWGSRNESFTRTREKELNNLLQKPPIECDVINNRYVPGCVTRCPWTANTYCSWPCR